MANTAEELAPEDKNAVVDEEQQETSAVTEDEVTEDTEDAPVDFLGMTDEEFEKTFNGQSEPVAKEEEKEEETSEVPPEEEPVVEDETVDTSEQSTSDTPVDPVDETSEKVDETHEAVDYKAAYEELTSPFMANGKEMTIENVDEAILLMKKGAGFENRMKQIKPHLKIIKTLENNNLLDVDKVNFLIDLDKKNPEAIKKLIKDSDYSPLEEEDDDNSDYVPNSYMVDDSTMAVDNVLDEISSSNSFQKTVDVITNQWDDTSRQIIASNPNAIKTINEHIELGVFDKITATVERERIFGRLNNMSDIEAYKQVGEQLTKAGAFNSQSSNAAQPDKPMTNTDNDNDKAELRKRKQAASLTKQKASVNKQTIQKNPLSMTDEEFEKFAL